MNQVEINMRQRTWIAAGLTLVEKLSWSRVPGR